MPWFRARDYTLYHGDAPGETAGEAVASPSSLAVDTAREANSDEVKRLRSEASQLKEALAEVLLENRLLKKSCPPEYQIGLNSLSLKKDPP